MVTLRPIAVSVLLLIVTVRSPVRLRAGTPAVPTSLFSQSVSARLNRDFPAFGVSFLLLDARTGQILASRWEHAEEPIPLGSLVKPFVALSYGEHHEFNYPIHNCRGTASGCWRPGGHGVIDLSSAVTYSCNSYFRALAAGLNASEVATTAIRFGLEPPNDDTSGAALTGLGGQWRTSPVHMATAYIELLRQRQRPAIKQIFDGMAESAQHGTASEVNRALSSTDALAKTGTAACTHSRHAPGDGFTIVMFPEEDPRLLLMVRVHGVPGAEAAKTAGQMLRRIEDQADAAEK